MAEYLFNRQNNEFIPANDRDSADYQCFFTYRKKRRVLTFVANHRVKLTNSYKVIKEGSLLWKKLLKEAIKESMDFTS